MWVIWGLHNEFYFQQHQNKGVWECCKNSIIVVTGLCSFRYAEVGIFLSGCGTSRGLVSVSSMCSFVCLNVDGSLMSTTTACFGGIIRDSTRVFLKGFYGVASHVSDVAWAWFILGEWL
jgi:hypothetical protein